MKPTKSRKKFFLRAAAVFLTLAAAVSAILAAIWNRAAYAVFRNLTMPSLRLDDTASWTGGESHLRLSYGTDSENQYLDLYVPKAAGQTLPKLFVLIHGGGFIAGDSQSRQAQFMYRYFRDQGYACASVNYRLAQEAAFPAAISDCKAAIRFLRAHAEEYGYDADSIAVWGESAGGYLAVMCAVTNDSEFMDVKYNGQDAYDAKYGISAKVDALVDYYGHIDQGDTSEDWKALGIPSFVVKIANSWLEGDVLQGYENVASFWLRKNISQMTAEEFAAVNPYTYIEKNDLSGLSAYIIHGDCDITVPYLHSQRLADRLTEKLGKENVHYRLIHDMGHASDPLYSEKQLSEVKDYLGKTLK